MAGWAVPQRLRANAAVTLIFSWLRKLGHKNNLTFIDQIGELNDPLANAIAFLAKDFKYKQLLALIDLSIPYLLFFSKRRYTE